MSRKLSVTRLLLVNLAIVGIAMLPCSSARADDGLYAGALSCGPAGSAPGFTQTVTLALRDGAGEWSSGKPDRDGYSISTLSVAPDGTARVSGHYLVGLEKRMTELTGHAESRSIKAAGRRGPRDCHLALDRPTPSGASAPYRLPYDVAALRARVRQVTRLRACPDAEAAPRDLLVEGFYRRDDQTYSHIDPDRLDAYNRTLKPIRAFESAISFMAGHALRTSKDNSEPSDCTVSLLDGWASIGALLGTMSSQGAYERKWSAITYALAFAETLPSARGVQAGRIAGWLRTIGDRVAIYYMQPPGGAMSDRANNHAYWAALSVVATGLASQDSDLFDWGMARFNAALDDIDADGFLALELARAGKALHYHRFSLEPLLLLAHIARANHVEIPPVGEAALRRLARRVRLGLDDPRAFAERSGRTQDEAGRSRSDWAWAELALALFNDPDLAARIAPLRPLSARWLGGDLTLRYARP